MTIKELKQKLEKYRDDAEVCIWDDSFSVVTVTSIRPAIVQQEDDVPLFVDDNSYNTIIIQS